MVFVTNLFGRHGKKPFLGICVGMQALYESSEEGAEKGLGVLAGSVLGLPPTANKIPHMG